MFGKGWERAAVLVAAVFAFTPGGVHAQGIEQYDYENLRLRGVGFEIFHVTPSDTDGTLGVGGRIDLGFLGPSVRMVLRGAYWGSELNDEETTRFETRIADLVEAQNGTRPTLDLGTIDREALIFGTDIHWMPTPAALARPYLGLGAEIYLLSASGEAVEGTFVDAALDLATAGVSAVGGLEYDVGSAFTAYGEGRLSLAADLKSFAITFGIAYLTR